MDGFSSLWVILMDLRQSWEGNGGRGGSSDVMGGEEHFGGGPGWFQVYERGISGGCPKMEKRRHYSMSKGLLLLFYMGQESSYEAVLQI